MQVRYIVNPGPGVVQVYPVFIDDEGNFTSTDELRDLGDEVVGEDVIGAIERLERERLGDKGWRLDG